jgi:hypothetical protein
VCSLSTTTTCIFILTHAISMSITRSILDPNPLQL